MPSKKSRKRRKTGRKRGKGWIARLKKIRLPSIWTVIRTTFLVGVSFMAVSVFWVFALRWAPVSGTLLMSMRSFSGVEVERQWVPIEDISPDLVRAVIAAEDTKFCTHHGFDIEQIRSALDDAKSGKRLRGASTISQQTAKNVFLWPGRGFVRKGLEAWFTLLIETLWPKERILEVYLNVAEWGDGYFGASAAAHGRFGNSAAELTTTEASLLAAVLPNPHDWHVAPAGPYVQRRSATIRARMGVIRRDGLDACVL